MDTGQGAGGRPRLSVPYFKEGPCVKCDRPALYRYGSVGVCRDHRTIAIQAYLAERPKHEAKGASIERNAKYSARKALSVVRRRKH